MGYYTTYTLKVVENNDDIDLDELMKKINGLDGSEFEDSEDMTCYCKWYDYTEHMKEISELYPKSILCLSGIGEDSGDLWKDYWLNGVGKHYDAQIVYHDDNFKNDLKGAEK